MCLYLKGALKFMKQKLVEQKRETERFTRIAGDFNTSLTPQKTTKDKQKAGNQNRIRL
jgi:hypothetical protein